MEGAGVAGRANGSVAAKDPPTPGPEPEKGAKGFGQDRQFRLTPDDHYSCLSQLGDTRLRSNRLDMDQVVATTFREERRRRTIGSRGNVVIDGLASWPDNVCECVPSRLVEVGEPFLCTAIAGEQAFNALNRQRDL